MTNRQAAIKVIKQLHKAGYQALLAGGCVRDMLLNRTAKDYDVATIAHPDEVVKLFKRTLKIGAKFGVIMVLDGNEQVEVATFRTEGGYADGRHPDAVEFSTAKEDAARRDFTINGMFYDPVEKKVFDFVAGQKDLARGIIRTIGDPHERFGEDYLRMLRAIRFSAQLGFAIEDNTWSAVCALADHITRISGERIAMELEATLASANRAAGVQRLIDSGLADAIFPGFNGEEAHFGVSVLSRLEQKVDFPLALAATFAGFETAFVTSAVKALKLSGAHIKHLTFLLDSRGKLLNADMPLAELKMIAGEPYFWDLHQLQRAIQKAKRQSTRPLMTIKKRALELKGKDLRPKPLLDGHQIISLGVQPGPMVGLVGSQMYVAQLGEELKSAEQAKKWVKAWLKKRQKLE